MYAIIETGGKQYRVTEGQILSVEKLEAEVGNSVDFDRVLLVGAGESIKVGAPFLAGVKVVAEVVKHGRGDKVHIIRFKRRKHQMKKQGHRQDYTQVKIVKVQA